MFDFKEGVTLGPVSFLREGGRLIVRAEIEVDMHSLTLGDQFVESVKVVTRFALDDDSGTVRDLFETIHASAISALEEGRVRLEATGADQIVVALSDSPPSLDVFPLKPVD